MKKSSQLGHIHLFGLFILFLALIAFSLVWKWNRKLISLNDQLMRDEHKIEALETKIKILELQNEVHQADVIRPTLPAK